ncbi:hypothetical protein [Deinococcus roseus]|uniref:Uncharacterized protein n=1 Tax=Deinococcus roseus TaxID=392414 RepID=A0ABQ2D0X3_9DEIO|nr:hypothetical protein [Deinococcus roseus]GGJ40409.1 hypothetical protein GCM10008938_28120 [Deinococcus roseus]
MSFFTHPSAWSGFHCELGIEFCTQNEKALETLMLHLWSFPELQGIYLEKDREPAEQQRFSLDQLLEKESILHLLLRGTVTLPDGNQVACSTSILREEAGSDWLFFSISTGSLEQVYPVVSSADGEDHQLNPWLRPLEDWLAELGMRLYRHQPYDLGIVGLNQMGMLNAEDILRDGIPEQRYWVLLWPDAEGLQYYPSNMG